MSERGRVPHTRLGHVYLPLDPDIFQGVGLAVSFGERMEREEKQEEERDGEREHDSPARVYNDKTLCS